MVYYLPLVLLLLVIIPILINKWVYKIQERIGFDTQQSRRLDVVMDICDIVAIALIVSAGAVFFYNLNR